MQNLDNVVEDVIHQFIDNGELFTGLDVSNKVKEVLPFARHSEVSEKVRLAFSSQMVAEGYAKTPIDVTLKDGSVRTAMLYHPLSDSWDLDNKYGAQKRNQVVVKLNLNPVAATVSSNGTITITPPAPVLPVPAPVANVPPAQAWAQLFNAQPSLFPKR